MGRVCRPGWARPRGERCSAEPFRGKGWLGSGPPPEAAAQRPCGIRRVMSGAAHQDEGAQPYRTPPRSTRQLCKAAAPVRRHLEGLPFRASSARHAATAGMLTPSARRYPDGLEACSRGSRGRELAPGCSSRWGASAQALRQCPVEAFVGGPEALAALASEPPGALTFVATRAPGFASPKASSRSGFHAAEWAKSARTCPPGLVYERITTRSPCSHRENLTSAKEQSLEGPGPGLVLCVPRHFRPQRLASAPRC